MLQVISDDPATEQDRQRNPLDEARSPRVFQPKSSFPLPKNVDDLLKFSTNPHDHLTYAMTWGILCIALGLMARQVGASVRAGCRGRGHA